jgi:multimeric flavodoxin WrbA
MTKVLAINSSPKKERSTTSLILDPFLDGMKEAGAVVELYYTRDLKINPCSGEFHCWVKQPGECYQRDDMQQLYPKLKNDDILVFATPVYVDGITGPLKTLVDRMIPLVSPLFELRDGHCRHPPREGVKHGHLVLVSNCGFHELDNFDTLVLHMKALCRNMSRTFAGALLRPQGPALRSMIQMGQPFNDITTAAKHAGRQLVENGKISSGILKMISRELVPREDYVREVNKQFQQTLDMHVRA